MFGVRSVIARRLLAEEGKIEGLSFSCKAILLRQDKSLFNARLEARGCRSWARGAAQE
jgi:hypothetical protein